jgi:cytochrome c oxidase cbb3-type subunit 3
MSDHDKTDVETTGHEWDGIHELNTPLPRWWLWTFYATIIWGVGYTIFYPAWPMVTRATQGMLGYSTRDEVAKEIARFDEMNSEQVAKLVSMDIADLTPDADPGLYNYAVQGGAAVFRAHCSQCHGAGAAGVQGAGYPNLRDDDWLWGGTMADIYYTVKHGIRNEDDYDARYSQMSAFGRDELLTDEKIDQVVEYVLQISGQDHDAALAEPGGTVFYNNCASCHMDDGTGDPTQGAPNLTDAIWLYGGDRDTIHETVYYARFGVMPAWGLRLPDAQVRQVAAYVHQLGGGEAAEPGE